MNLKTPTAGIILAAGMSLRFGETKQLFKLKKRTLIERVVDAALASTLERVVLVLGHDSTAIRRSLLTRTDTLRLMIVENPAFRQGMSTSLHFGLKAVCDEFSSVMVLLADQPLIRARHIDKLLRCYLKSDKNICAPLYRGLRGNPVIFGRRFYRQLLDIRGDIGGRSLLQIHSHEIAYLETDDPAFVLDIDTPDDLKKLNSIDPIQKYF